jgi:uncharacterized caspase-like protein
MRWCVAVLFAAICCLAATVALAEHRVALVVGNSQYAYTSALPNPRNDAEDIARTLKQVGFEVTVGYDLDQVKFARVIDDFARALEGADVGLFFYAGHGLQINGKNYLVSTGARLESTFLVPSETIELDAIIRLMESKTGTNLIFLDACRNNSLADNLKRNLSAANRAASVGRGLAPITPDGRDTLVAFSTAPGEVAADGNGRNSPFAASLLRHMPERGLEVSVMLKDVTAYVRRETNNTQRPQQLSDMSKKFYFVNAESPPVALLQPPASATQAVAPVDPAEVAFWQSAASECESVRAYLREYPNGKFTALALIKERQLCKTGSEITIRQPPSSPELPSRQDSLNIVKAFYAALSRADGVAAVAMMIPEKRGTKNFDPVETRKFWSDVRQFEVQSIEALTDDTIVATYKYTKYTGSKGNVCDTMSTLKTVRRGDSTLIESISAKC